MAHDYAVYGAILAIFGLVVIALVQGVGDNLVNNAITALVTLAGVKVALKHGRGRQAGAP